MVVACTWGFAETVWNIRKEGTDREDVLGDNFTKSFFKLKKKAEKLY